MNLKIVLFALFIGCSMGVASEAVAHPKRSIMTRQLPLKTPKRFHKQYILPKVIVQRYHILDDNDDTEFLLSNTVVGRARKPIIVDDDVAIRLAVARLRALRKHKEIWG